MKLPLVVGACLGLLAVGCASDAPRFPTSAALAIAGATTDKPLDGARGFTHLALVIDTSGSMRDPRNGRLWPVVTPAVVNVLATHPEIKWIQCIDTNGRSQLGRSTEWIPYSPRTTDQLVALLENSSNDGVSNPMPGLLKALALPLPAGPNERMHICVLGDELNAEVNPALREIERLNWPDGSGGWRASISAVQVPTMGFRANTAAKFEALMAELAKRHGGTYHMLADLHQL